MNIRSGWGTERISVRFSVRSKDLARSDIESTNIRTLIETCHVDLRSLCTFRGFWIPQRKAFLSPAITSPPPTTPFPSSKKSIPFSKSSHPKPPPPMQHQLSDVQQQTHKPFRWTRYRHKIPIWRQIQPLPLVYLENFLPHPHHYPHNPPCRGRFYQMKVVIWNLSLEICQTIFACDNGFRSIVPSCLITHTSLHTIAPTTFPGWDMALVSGYIQWLSCCPTKSQPDGQVKHAHVDELIAKKTSTASCPTPSPTNIKIHTTSICWQILRIVYASGGTVWSIQLKGV